MLFTPGAIGSLTLANRLIRSATAEHMADSQGRPRPELKELYRELARGGVGLIITGHMYVHPSGKAHPSMTGIYTDEFLPELAELAEAVHSEEGRIVVQINHGGMQCHDVPLPETLAPSAIEAPFLAQPARGMTTEEIAGIVESYGQAARRVREAGFDGVQIHSAHGYLISEFLSPYVNRRKDRWGGDIEGRMLFLRRVAAAVRHQVGPDYPVLIKLGMMDAVEGGLTPDEAVRVVAAIEGMGLDAVEISGGVGGGGDLNVRKKVRSKSEEAYFLPLAKLARQATTLPISLVGGFRTREVMEQVLNEGHADFISLCRPLISEPDLPNLMRKGEVDVSRCISANLCWPDEEGEGIACKCPID